VGIGRHCQRLNRRIAFALAMIALAFPQISNASPWSRDDGEIMIISRVDYFRSNLENVSVAGAPVDGKFERIETNNYVEFGLTDRLTLGGKAFYGRSWLSRGDFTESASGFTEIETFAQYQVFRNPRHAGAVKITGGIPTEFESGARPTLDSDGVDLELSALYGRSLTFEPIKTFAAVEVGMRKRFGDAADQVRILTTIGIEPTERWGLLIDTYSTVSLRNENFGGADFDVFKVQPSLVWKATRRFSLQIGMSEEIAGRNLDLGTTYFVGLRTRF